MGNWYRVVKTIKGHRDLYDQQTYRAGGQVRTLNRYIGRVDDDAGAGSSGASHSGRVNAPLFRSAGDFGQAMVEQFDAPKWVEDAVEQIAGYSPVTTQGQKWGHRSAYFSRATDHIQMPFCAAFTGSKQRLGRANARAPHCPCRSVNGRFLPFRDLLNRGRGGVDRT